jgi:transposase
MAYREVRTMDIDQVIRRWLAGEGIRAVARATGLDRKTVRRIVRLAGEVGLKPGGPPPEEATLQRIRERLGRPGAPRSLGACEQALQAHRGQIQIWLQQEGLLLTKVHELLGRQGVSVPYASLHRFAQKRCEFGSRSSVTVRRMESTPGEVAEVDFGRLGLFQDLGSSRPRQLHAFIMVLGYSRLSCVVPTFRQDLEAVIDCFEQAFEFFQGCPRRVVVDNLKACVDAADSYSPRLQRTFLEYAAFRGFLADPARPAHPKDKPVVENQVRYVRERFFKGERFIDLEDVARRARSWCGEVAGRRIHGTTQRVPIEVFEAEEKATLIPLNGKRFDPPRWVRAKVHPDHHLRFDNALYSVPTRWVGGVMDVRGDRSLVRIYSRGELIKTHTRKLRGGRSTDYTDYPETRAPYAMRWPDFYRKRAAEIGPEVGKFTEQLLSGEFPWSRLRQAQKLLRLAERYGSQRLEAACRRALQFDLIDVHRVGHILEQALEQQSTPEPLHGQQLPLAPKFLRPAEHFAHRHSLPGGSDEPSA